MINEFIFLIQCLVTASGAFFALYLGSSALIVYIIIQLVAANFFVTKAIQLWGMTATAADAFTISSIISLHLLQEFYGKQIAQKTVTWGFYTLLFLAIVGQLHLSYIPNIGDETQIHFQSLLGCMPRIFLASLTSYWITQQFDCWLYQIIKDRLTGKYMPLRTISCAAFSQCFDTILFSILGLWGIISPLWQLMLVSYVIKISALLLMSPVTALARKAFDRSSYSIL